MSEAALSLFSTLLGEPFLNTMEHHETPLDSVTSTVGNDIVAEISYKGMVQKMPDGRPICSYKLPDK